MEWCVAVTSTNIGAGFCPYVSVGGVGLAPFPSLHSHCNYSCHYTNTVVSQVSAHEHVHLIITHYIAYMGTYLGWKFITDPFIFD